MIVNIDNLEKKTRIYDANRLRENLDYDYYINYTGNLYRSYLLDVITKNIKFIPFLDISNRHKAFTFAKKFFTNTKNFFTDDIEIQFIFPLSCHEYVLEDVKLQLKKSDTDEELIKNCYLFVGFFMDNILNTYDITYYEDKFVCINFNKMKIYTTYLSSSFQFEKEFKTTLSFLVLPNSIKTLQRKWRYKFMDYVDKKDKGIFESAPENQFKIVMNEFYNKHIAPYWIPSKAHLDHMAKFNLKSSKETFFNALFY